MCILTFTSEVRELRGQADQFLLCLKYGYLAIQLKGYIA